MTIVEPVFDEGSGSRVMAGMVDTDVAEALRGAALGRRVEMTDAVTWEEAGPVRGCVSAPGGSRAS